MALKIAKSKLFAKTLKDRHEQTVLNNLKKFVEFKVEHPSERYGGSDYAFSGGGPLQGYWHCHLNRDKSLIYKIEQGLLKLFGIFTHQDLGTGTPSSQPKQKSAAQKFDNQEF